MAEKKTRLEIAKERADKAQAAYRAELKKEKEKAQVAQLKVIRKLFPDLPLDEEGTKKYFEGLLRYADMGVKYEEKLKAKQQQQAGQGQHQK